MTDPTRGAEPSAAALAAVGEFRERFSDPDKVFWRYKTSAPLEMDGRVTDWLLAALSRVEAEARREERERVWKKAIDSLGGIHWDNPERIIREAAQEDGCNLTPPTGGETK